MDLFRGFTSNSLDVALQILNKKIKVGEDQDPFRSHTSRDIDDCLNNILNQVLSEGNSKDSAKKGGPTINHPVDFTFMILAGERASRIDKSSMDELLNNQTVEFASRLEMFFGLPRPAEEKAFNLDGAKKQKNNNNNKDKDVAQSEDGANQSGDKQQQQQQRSECVNTHLDSDSQTAIAHRLFATAVRFYGDWAVKVSTRASSVGRRAINALYQYIQNWTPGQGHLTPAHAAIVEVGLKTHNAFAVSALGILDTPIFEINPNLSGCSIFDYLDFYYFGGLCYASLQRWGEAADMLEQVTLAPANGLSVRTIAAVKAHLLVTAILQGEGSAPENMRKGKYLSEVCRDYALFVDSIGKAVGSKSFDMTSFIANIPNDAGTDGLAALAQQAVNSIPYHRARNLTRTYLTVSLAALGAECGGSEAAAEARVREMILNKQLDCTIDRANKVVTFSVAGTSSSSSSGNATSSSSSSKNPYEATTEEEALRNVMEVNKIIAQRQERALLAPGHVLAVMGGQDLSIAAEMTKKEMDNEKSGLLAALRR